MCKRATYKDIVAFYKDKALENDDLSKFIADYGDEDEAYQLFFKSFSGKGNTYIQGVKDICSANDALKDMYLCELEKPNQKWHLLVSYIAVKAWECGGQNFWDRPFIYWRYAKCPELMIWMACEAKVDDTLIKKALEVAIICCESGNALAKKMGDLADAKDKTGIDTIDTIKAKCRKANRQLAATLIRALIPWEKINEKICESRKDCSC